MADQVESFSAPRQGGQDDPSNVPLNGAAPEASLPVSIPSAPAGIAVEPDGFPGTSLSPPSNRLLNAEAAVFVPRVASPMLGPAGGPSRGSPGPPQPHQMLSMSPPMPVYNAPHPPPMGYGPGMGAQGMYGHPGGGGYMHSGSPVEASPLMPIAAGPRRQARGHGGHGHPHAHGAHAHPHGHPPHMGGMMAAAQHGGGMAMGVPTVMPPAGMMMPAAAVECEAVVTMHFGTLQMVAQVPAPMAAQIPAPMAAQAVNQPVAAGNALAHEPASVAPTTNGVGNAAHAAAAVDGAGSEASLDAAEAVGGAGSHAPAGNGAADGGGGGEAEAADGRAGGSEVGSEKKGQSSTETVTVGPEAEGERGEKSGEEREAEKRDGETEARVAEKNDDGKGQSDAQAEGDDTEWVTVQHHHHHHHHNHQNQQPHQPQQQHKHQQPHSQQPQMHGHSHAQAPGGQAHAQGKAGAQQGAGGGVGQGKGKQGKQGKEPVVHLPSKELEEVKEKMVRQVEFYLSDQNLPTDNHLMKLVRKDPEGHVPLKIIAEFRKIRALVPQGSPNIAVVNLLAAALRTSPFLVVSEDGKKVRRAVALGEVDLEEVQSRTVVAENLPQDHSIPAMEALFSKAGKVKMVRVCKPEAANSANQAASAAAVAAVGTGGGGGGGSNAGRHGHKQHAHHHEVVVTNKLHALVEYETVEAAEKAVELLTDENNWRSGLHVRLLIRKPLHKQHQHHHQHPHQQQHQPQQQHAHAGKGKKGSQSSLHSNHSSSGSLSAASGAGATGGTGAGGGGGGRGGVDSASEEYLLDAVAASEGLLALDGSETDGDTASNHNASPTAAYASAHGHAGGGGRKGGGSMPALSPPGDGALSAAAATDNEVASSPRKGRAIKGRNKGQSSKLSGSAGSGSGSAHNHGSSLSRTPNRDGSGNSLGGGRDNHHHHQQQHGHHHSPNNTPPRSRIGSGGRDGHNPLHPHHHSHHHHHHHLHGGGTPPKGGSLPSPSFLLHGSPLGGAGGGILGCGALAEGGSSPLVRPPPGPRMPDGTKGFAVGRGKRLSAT